MAGLRSPIMTDPEPLTEVLAGDPGAAAEEDCYTDPALEGLRDVPGTIGTLGTAQLGDIAGRLAAIGHESHSAFGDRIVVVAGRVQDIAREARRRLHEDRLPDDQRPAGDDLDR